MSDSPEPPAIGVLDQDGPTAPPRRNGELVFEAPWQSRLFGLTMALHRSGLFDWEEFRHLLIDEIESWQRRHPSGAGWSYYERWQAAFERLLSGKGLCTSGDVTARTGILAGRPPDHDH